MLKGFKEFLARGNIIDLSVAVVIGTAFTGLVTKFTESVIQPLVDRIGAGGKSDVGILKINIGGGQFIDFNVALSAAINFIIIASVVYFLVVLPTTRCASVVKSSKPRTPNSHCSLRSGISSPNPVAAQGITPPTPRKAPPSRTGSSQPAPQLWCGGTLSRSHCSRSSASRLACGSRSSDDSCGSSVPNTRRIAPGSSPAGLLSVRSPGWRVAR